MEKLRKMEIYMDKDRGLYLRDSKKTYRFWARGWGIPVSLVVQTSREIAREKKQAEREEEERRQAQTRTRKEREAKRLLNRLIQVIKGK